MVNVKWRINNKDLLFHINDPSRISLITPITPVTLNTHVCPVGHKSSTSLERQNLLICIDQLIPIHRLIKWPILRLNGIEGNSALARRGRWWSSALAGRGRWRTSTVDRRRSSGAIAILASLQNVRKEENQDCMRQGQKETKPDTWSISSCIKVGRGSNVGWRLICGWTGAATVKNLNNGQFKLSQYTHSLHWEKSQSQSSTF